MAWGGDRLNRKESADFLTAYLRRQYEEGGNQSFVLALNSQWGSGKTFLLENWRDALQEDKTIVIYFNAWQNDYSEDPLIGLLHELIEQLNSEQSLVKQKGLKGKIAFLKEAGMKVIRPSSEVLFEVLSHKLLGLTSEQLGQALSKESIDKLSHQLTQAAFKEHATRKGAIIKFKETISNFIKTIESNTNIKLPIFIFIDELDRCRPNYAIELLEAVKHIFEISGVHFIVALSVLQLKESIGVVYGTNFESEKYLKRFFNQEYRLNDPDLTTYTNYIFSERKIIPDSVQSKIWVPIEQFNHPMYTFESYIFSTLAKEFGLSLRDVEQVSETLKAVLLTWKGKTVHLVYLITWIMIKHVNSNNFETLKNQSTQLSVNSLDILLIPLNGDSAFRRRNPQFPRHEQEFLTDSIISIFKIYFRLAKSNLKDLAENRPRGAELDALIGNALCRDFPNTYDTTKFYPTGLEVYPDLVSRAGQFG